MMIDAMVGLVCLGLSIFVVVVGQGILRLRSWDRRARWVVLLLAIHPLVCTNVEGDVSRYLSRQAPTILIFIVACVILALAWPPDISKSRASKRITCGTLAGLTIAFPLAWLPWQRIPYFSGRADLSLLATFVASSALAGAAVAWALASGRSSDRGGHSVGLGLFLLLPVVLAPVFLATTPIILYQTRVRHRAPFQFLILGEDGTPIEGARVTRIDVRYLDDQKHQTEGDVTGADGRVETLLNAVVNGRVGLLRRTQDINFRPWLVRVDAPGYRTFLAPLANETLPAVDQKPTDPPLGLTYPPPASVTIRLTPSSTARPPKVSAPQP